MHPVHGSLLNWSITTKTQTNTKEYVYDENGRLIGGLHPNRRFNSAKVFAGARHLATYDSVMNMTYFIHDAGHAASALQRLGAKQVISLAPRCSRRHTTTGVYTYLISRGPECCLDL